MKLAHAGCPCDARIFVDSVLRVSRRYTYVCRHAVTTHLPACHDSRYEIISWTCYGNKKYSDCDVSH